MPHVHDLHNGSTLSYYLPGVVKLHNCTSTVLYDEHRRNKIYIFSPIYAWHVKKDLHTVTIARTYKSGSLPAADFTRISFPAGCGPQSTRVAATRVVGGWQWLAGGELGGGMSVHWCWHRIGPPASTISCCFSAPGVGIRMQLLNTARTATHIFASFWLFWVGHFCCRASFLEWVQLWRDRRRGRVVDTTRIISFGQMNKGEIELGTGWQGQLSIWWNKTLTEMEKVDKKGYRIS